MAKKTILVGVRDGLDADTSMQALERCLFEYKIPICRVDKTRKVLETDNTFVKYVRESDYPGYLDGYRADAVFGIMSDAIKYHMMPEAEIWKQRGFSLLSFIVKVERAAMITNTDLMLAVGCGRRSGKTETCLKYMLNSIYGTKGDAYMEYCKRDVDTLRDIVMRNGYAAANGNVVPAIKSVHFSGPVTAVIWADGTKTIVRCYNDNLDQEKGLAMAIAKKALGTNKSGSNYYDIFKKWLPKDED